MRHGWVFIENMESKYKKELQSIYEMSLSNDIEAKNLAISLFWTSEYVKNNKIKPELRLCVPRGEIKSLKLNNIGYYIDKDNIAKYKNFSWILYDLIHDNVYLVKEEVK